MSKSTENDRHTEVVIYDDEDADGRMPTHYHDGTPIPIGWPDRKSEANFNGKVIAVLAIAAAALLYSLFKGEIFNNKTETNQRIFETIQRNLS